MRLQTSNDFATRPTEQFFEKPKYFLIYEGESTEPKYFRGIEINRSKLAINQNITIVSVLRSLSELHNSHPKFVLMLAEKIVNSSNLDFVLKEELFKMINDFVAESNMNNKDILIQKAKDYIDNYVEDEINISEINNVILDVYKNDVFGNIAYDIMNYFAEQRSILDYNPEIDVINLIIDRDKGSFKSEQYDKIVTECQNNNIKLYVSNPCFETWLLMHFDEFEQLDFDKLKENKRISSGKSARKYSDKMLSDIIGYDKSNLKFDTFIDKIDDAIEREKKYAENIEELKDNIGSNIGILITELRK